MIHPEILQEPLSGEGDFATLVMLPNTTKHFEGNKRIKCEEDHLNYDATFAVAKGRPEKIQACTGLKPLTSAILVQRSNQLSYQANWELVI